jgi:thiol-disulfide isomerase/thioredoxin
MKRWVATTLALLLLLGLTGCFFAQEVPPPTFKPGSKVDNITLRDLKGGSHKLYDLGRDGKLTVIMFIATQCPVSNAYNQRMVALDRDYAGKGVKFLAVNSNRQESVREVADHAAKNGFAFPVFKDENNVVADLFGASVTPETYVLDETWTMRYHGRIDNSQDAAKVGTSDLRNVLEVLLAGKSAPVTETKAFGCTIKRVKKT